MALWIIAPEVWEGDVHGDIRTSLKNKNIEYIEFKRNEYGKYVTSSYAFQEYEGPIVVRGPIKFVNYLYYKYPHLNFVTHFKDGFMCSEYLSEFPSEWFLNSNGNFTTYGLLKKRGIKSPCFIRPNSPFKTFTGFTLTPENFNIEMNSLEKLNHLSNSELILMSDNKVIDSEFRYVVCNKKIIGYSEYRWDGVLDIRRDTLPECLELAETVASHNKQIDDIYVVDIGMVEGEPKVIEFNSFCSSGLYAIDLDNLVDEIEMYVNNRNDDELLY